MTEPHMTPEDFLRTLTRARQHSNQDQWAEAIPLWKTVVMNNPSQADFWMSLGDAHVQELEHEPAIDAYRQAFALGAGFPFHTAYQLARCYAQIDQLDDALRWLDRAFELGYRDLETAQTDEAFTSLQSTDQFRRRVGLVDAEQFSRDAGWQYDLDFFAREVKRKAFYPWRKVSEHNFDSAINQLDQDIPSLTDYQIVVEMRRILTLLGDGHARVNPADDHPLAPGTLPLQFYLFEEGLFIIASTPEHADLLGYQVLRFGDQTIDRLLETLTPTVPRDNDQWIKLRVPYLIRELPMLHAMELIPEPDRVDLTVRDADGEESTVSIAAGPHPSTDTLYYAFPHPEGWEFYPATLESPLPRYIRNQAAHYWFEYLPDEQTVYFQFNRVANSADETFPQFSERLFDFIDDHDVRKLAIDVRWNNGGNTLLEMPFIHRLIGHRINQRGQLFVVIGRRTFSAAQNFSTMLDRHTEVIFVGEPTGSSPNFVGETIHIEMPYSKIVLNVSDLYWQSSWPMDYRTWIAPLLFIPPSFSAYSENRDPALEAILDWSDHLPGM